MFAICYLESRFLMLGDLIPLQESIQHPSIKPKPSLAVPSPAGPTLLVLSWVQKAFTSDGKPASRLIR